MRSEKEKMLAGEPYEAWDEELFNERIECRKVLQTLNNSIPNTPEWRSAVDRLIPDSEGAYLEPPFRCDYIGAGSVVTKDIPSNVVAAGNPCRIIRSIDQGDA
ncbi:maltose acetyltransferase domain-containing protein [Vibrio sinaloensis]|uniref:maltose acetyltransferase domain-containing protein n=1 Tax=Photobacterium sp. (strain ATCC 43367) TaxID=379097 RepID=UPI002F41439E